MFRPRSLLFALILCGLPLTSAQSQQPAQIVRPPVATDLRRLDLSMVFIQGDQQFPARLVSGRIGVVMRESSAREAQQIEGFRRQVAGSELQGFAPSTFAVAAPNARNFQGHVEAARAFEREFANVVQDAGVLVLVGEAQAPMILTDQIIVQLRPGAQRAQIETLTSRASLALIGANPFVEGQFVVELQGGDARNALAVSNALNRDPAVAWAHPNFYVPIDYRQAAFIPNDTFFADQWHLNNTGQNAGTVDADIDANFAWGITRGNNAIVIAVMDDAVQFNHPDLQPNLFTNAGDPTVNGADNDGNGFIDDVNGWDFTACAAAPPCGDNDPNPAAADTHGTPVAGGAVARGDNALGVSGSCPNCRMLPVRGLNGPVFAHSLMFGYAAARGAHVITNSWGYVIGTPATLVVTNAITNAATNGRGGRGSIVLFAMNNVNVNDCIGATPDISSHAQVIAVSRVTNRDRFDNSGFGNCMDVLGPTRSQIGFGTLSGVTTDMIGAGGRNPGGPAGCTQTLNLDYTFCFGGTSFATPVTAGVVGLMLSVDNTRNRDVVQRALQDTTDRVEHSLGAYSPTTGFSTPATGQATHGFGRVNAFEAVRLLGPTAAGGRAGVDLVIRDNTLDWGNTEQPSFVVFEPARVPIPHWESADIKVDAPPYAATPTTSAQFDAFVHENPLSSNLNRVYVRVRNRGPTSAASVRVKLHWSFAGLALPALPGDFWTAFPADSADTSIWHPIGTVTVPSIGYSGVSVAGGAGDASAILTFDFNAPVYDPAQPNPSHYCLFAVVEAASDPVLPASRASLIPDDITPRDNNVTHRNLRMIDSGIRSEERFMISNPFPYDVETIISIQASRGFRVRLEGVEQGQRLQLRGGESRMATLQLEASPQLRGVGSVTVTQRIYRGEREVLTGGMTYQLAPPRRLLDRPPINRPPLTPERPPIRPN